MLPGSGFPRSSLVNFLGYFNIANLSTHRMLAKEKWVNFVATCISNTVDSGF